MHVQALCTCRADSAPCGRTTHSNATLPMPNPSGTAPGQPSAPGRGVEHSWEVEACREANELAARHIVPTLAVGLPAEEESVRPRVPSRRLAARIHRYQWHGHELRARQRDGKTAAMYECSRGLCAKAEPLSASLYLYKRPGQAWTIMESAGHTQQSAVGCQPVVSSEQRAVGRSMQAVGSRKKDAGSRKQEAGSMTHDA